MNTGHTAAPCATAGVRGRELLKHHEVVKGVLQWFDTIPRSCPFTCHSWNDHAIKEKGVLRGKWPRGSIMPPPGPHVLHSVTPSALRTAIVSSNAVREVIDAPEVVAVCEVVA